jgi:hypothetical protein
MFLKPKPLSSFGKKMFSQATLALPKASPQPFHKKRCEQGGNLPNNSLRKDE